MKKHKISNPIFIVLLVMLTVSCEDFLEVEAPDNRIVSETVFNSEETALSAMTGIYNELFRASFSSGWENSVHVLAGLSADELQTLRSSDLTLIEFEQNEILPDNSRNLSLWASTYKIIYMANSLLEGLENSNNISQETAEVLEGEAKFVRAFTYFYLVNLYGDVPLLLSTDYRKNSLASREDQEIVYEQIVLDLSEAIDLLADQYRDGDRTRANKFAAMALLARVHLYLENWQEAEELSTHVISNTSTYELAEDLNQTFLANSKEAIWQISPIGRGGSLSYTNEGLTFIFHPIFSFLTKVSLTEDLVDSFAEEDMRLQSWIGYNDKSERHFAFKYKDRSSMENITEYSMVLRLAEQYLIRAEARAMQNDIPGALDDLDSIRLRAGLEALSSMEMPPSTSEELLNFIMEERRKELFTEWGHRWLDLKRTGKAKEELSKKKSFWDDTDVMYPIPLDELIKNSNLL